jgi:hypothetical protein
VRRVADERTKEQTREPRLTWLLQAGIAKTGRVPGNRLLPGMQEAVGFRIGCWSEGIPGENVKGRGASSAGPPSRLTNPVRQTAGLRDSSRW